MAATREFRAFDATLFADRLQGTITTPTSLDTLEARAQVVREQVEARIQAPTPKAIEAAARDSLRLMLSSFALAIAFAMGAQRKGSDVPLLVEWHTMLSVRGPGPGHPADDVLRAMPLPGVRRPDETDYFSRLVPEEAPQEPGGDPNDSDTGLPPPA
jgi:hypothetical protein